ncbi:hypothetical protein DTO027I6_9766 [Penicillium roqueforti]|nr:hypothetical protein CBS147337_9837 [Penicillium roqueforti]KAI3185337.1 hypothetical protein DTO027I6_9766 [Penicillium roqueforti]
MRDVTIEERLDALRRVREANQGDSAPGGSHRGLTTWLHDGFRIRTRARGAEAETSADADNAAPSPLRLRWLRRPRRPPISRCLLRDA